MSKSAKRSPVRDDECSVQAKRPRDDPGCSAAQEDNRATVPWLSVDVMILIFNLVVLFDPLTAVQVLPLVCRRWRQLLRDFITFQNMAPLLSRFTCSIATVASRFKTVRSLDDTDFLCVTPHCVTAIGTHCPNIVYLALRNSCITTRICNAEIAAIASGCRKLTHIDLSNYGRITGVGFAAVGLIVTLTHLDLSCTFIADAGLAAIASGCCDLIHLDLRCCRHITDAGLAAVDRLKSLTHLNLSRTFITDGVLTAIVSECRNLTYIDLSYCKRITGAGFGAVGRIGSLTHLYLSGTRITDTGLAVIVDGCRYLIRLDLNWCERITDVGRIGSLTHLYLNGTRITDAGVTTIVSGCHNLTHVDVGDCELMTSAGYSALVRLGSLTHLILSDQARVGSITDMVLTAIASGCRDLTYVYLYECNHITDAGLMTFASECYNISHISVTDCDLITYTTKPHVYWEHKHHVYQECHRCPGAKGGRWRRSLRSLRRSHDAVVDDTQLLSPTWIPTS